MRQLQVPVLYDFSCTFTVFSSDWLLLLLLDLFVLLPKSFGSPALLFAQGNSTPTPGIFSSAVPASTHLDFVPQFPSINKIHWYESSFPLVNCKPNFWIDCPWFRYVQTCGLFSCNESSVRWYKTCPPLDRTMGVLLRRVNEWADMTGPHPVLRFCSVGPTELEWQLSMWSQIKTRIPPHPTRLQLPRIYCGTSMWCKHACWLRLLLTAAMSLRVEKPHGASQNLLLSPSSLLKIEKGPVQAADFGAGSSRYLFPG